MAEQIQLPPPGPLPRSGFFSAFAHIKPVLEIGPFDRPIFRGEEVFYFDVLDQDGLVEKASHNPRRTGKVPFIHFVSPTGDLSIVDKTFTAVCSSHAIEHQPDLIKHLSDVGRLLDAGGYYFLAIPDKRYCFDHFGPESSVADAIEAQGRKVHSLANIIRQIGLHTHNDVLRHWAGDHENPGYRTNVARRVEKAIRAYEASNGAYLDAHAWRFTPQSFRETIKTIYDLGLSPLVPVRVYETPEPRVEFMAILQKS